MGYYYVDANNNGVRDGSEACSLCPNNLGYGTGTLSTCSTKCKTNEWYDATSLSCQACPGNRVTNPDAPLGSTTNPGVQVCVCGPGTYLSSGTYSSASGTCTACAGGGSNFIVKSVPAYGATSSSQCSVTCAAGYQLTPQTTCFKCQSQTIWSPGGLVDPTGPSSCWLCNQPGFIAARVVSGGYKCNETGQFGNDVCIPCNLCSVSGTSTLPNSYGTCTPPAR